MPWSQIPTPVVDDSKLDNDLPLDNDFPLERGLKAIWGKIVRTVTSWTKTGRPIT